MIVEFKDSTKNEGLFFNILPDDWKEGIVPFWADYKSTSRIFILQSNDEVVGGGILFSTVSPDTLNYKEEAQQWFDNGYLYIGFLYISQVHRDKKLGSLWIQNVFKKFPRQKFWLSIEEFPLVNFYTRNGFQLVKKIKAGKNEEWIMASS